MAEYIIDGTNICCLGTPKGKEKDNAKLDVLLILLIEILKNGDSFYCFFDASFRHWKKIKNKKMQEIYNKLLKNTKYFSEVTGGMMADDAIIARADYTKGKIISNDRYKPYWEKYTWLNQDETSRLIKSNLSGEILSVPSLNITVALQKDIQTYADELFTLLRTTTNHQNAKEANSDSQNIFNKHLIDNHVIPDIKSESSMGFYMDHTTTKSVAKVLPRLILLKTQVKFIFQNKLLNSDTKILEYIDLILEKQWVKKFKIYGKDDQNLVACELVISIDWKEYSFQLKKSAMVDLHERWKDDVMIETSIVTDEFYKYIVDKNLRTELVYIFNPKRDSDMICRELGLTDVEPVIWKDKPEKFSVQNPALREYSIEFNLV